MIRIVLFLLCVLGHGVAAQDAAIIAHMPQVFDKWRLDVGAEKAVLILQKDDEILLQLSHGWTDDQPVDMASISKSITALCVATLIRDGMLAPDTTSRAVLGYGADGITVAELLTHSSGLKPDQTQAVMYLWLDTDIAAGDLASRRALGREVHTQDKGNYFYNNENYAILGEMIARVTGQSYRTACMDRVINPAGALTVSVSKRTGATLSWGGWTMPIADYARILTWGYGPDGIVGNVAHNWPTSPVSDHVSYGMGMFQRVRGDGLNFWHFGAWCYPLRFNTGAYAVRWQNGYSIVAAYDVCLDTPQMRALDRAMVEVVFK